MAFLNKKSAFAYSALAVSVMVAQAEAATIQGLSANQINDSTTQLRITFDGKPVMPSANQTGANQLILDFNQTSSSGLPRNMPINRGVIGSVTALNSGNLTRLMVGLNGAANYSSSVDGNQLLINVTSKEGMVPMQAQPTYAPTPAPVQMAPAPVQPVQTVAPMQTAAPMAVQVNPLLTPTGRSMADNLNGVSSINYAGKGAGGGNVTIALVNEAIPVDVQRQGNKIVVRTQGSTIPRHLLRQIQGNGLVTSVNAVNQGQSGMITLTMSGDYEYQAYQSGSSLHISVVPPKPMREPTLEEKTYTGEALSMEFQDVSVRTVLDVLGQFTTTNIVAADNVTGNITLRLINVPWDQALDIILRSKNLGKRQNGNVILVAPAAELDKQDEEELTNQQKRKIMAPVRTEYVRLNYAKAAEVIKLIDDADSRGRSGDTGGKTALLESPDGVITADARTNTIIIKDTSAGINNIRALIDKIDIPVKQVMIEARVVTASETFSKEIGVNWGSTRKSDTNPFSSKNNSSWTDSHSQSRNPSSSLSVDLGGAAGVGGSLTLGLLSISDMLLDLNLSALKAEGRGEVISAPKVLTADKQKARISSGKQIPYQEASASGATSVSFKEAVLSLEATPNITPDGKISLQLDIKNGDTTGETYAGVPVIREDNITTNVVLEDGQTVVLGGVFRNTIDNGQRKVPFLGDVPGLGRLFKYDKKTNEKTELLIFITPRLVNDGISRIN